MFYEAAGRALEAINSRNFVFLGSIAMLGHCILTSTQGDGVGVCRGLTPLLLIAHCIQCQEIFNLVSGVETMRTDIEAWGLLLKGAYEVGFDGLESADEGSLCL